MTEHFNPTLVLNADYTPLSQFPLSLLGWQDVVKGIFLDKYHVVAEYEDVIRAQSFEMFLPSVVALRQYQPIAQRVGFTRFNVFLRDRFTCQYCGVPHSELTFDHVIPRAKGGTTCWENIVAACEPCNTMKGSGLHMKPIREPVKPTVGEMQAAARRYPPGFLHETWRDFLHWDVELQP